MVYRCVQKVHLCQGIWRNYKQITDTRIKCLLLMWKKVERRSCDKIARRIDVELEAQTRQKVRRDTADVQKTLLTLTQEEEDKAFKSALRQVVEPSKDIVAQDDDKERSAASLWKKVMKDSKLVQKSRKVLSVEERLRQHLRAVTETSQSISCVVKRKKRPSVKYVPCCSCCMHVSILSVVVRF